MGMTGSDRDEKTPDTVWDLSQRLTAKGHASVWDCILADGQGVCQAEAVLFCSVSGMDDSGNLLKRPNPVFLSGIWPFQLFCVFPRFQRWSASGSRSGNHAGIRRKVGEERLIRASGSVISRCRHSWSVHGRTDRSRRSRARFCWASRNQGSCGPGRDSSAQTVPCTEGSLW